MFMTSCCYCGSEDLRTKEVEIRRVNARTMAVASRERVTELECRRCGWAGPTERVVALAFS